VIVVSLVAFGSTALAQNEPSVEPIGPPVAAPPPPPPGYYPPPPMPPPYGGYPRGPARLRYEPGDPIAQAQGQPTAESIIDKYIAAVGGAQKAAALTSFTGMGTYRGYDDSEETPLEIAVNANGQYYTAAHPASGPHITTFDGRAAWYAAPPTDRPFPIIALTGQEMDGIKLQAQLFFPSQIKTALRNWRTGFGTEINDRRVNVLQGNLGMAGTATLCFDAQTGLLVRMLRYGPSPVGRIVTRVDYSDYRDVGNTGVKMPFKWTMSWLDGRNVYALTSVQPNPRIDAAKFAKPAAVR